jgi:hypothetical protein
MCSGLYGVTFNLRIAGILPRPPPSRAAVHCRNRAVNAVRHIQYIGVCVYKDTEFACPVKGKGISITVKPRTFQIKLWQNRFVALQAFSDTEAYNHPKLSLALLLPCRHTSVFSLV